MDSELKKDNNKLLTTAAGAPVYAYEDSMTVGPRGPVLLQDGFLQEKLAHFNRERIPERVVHAKGSGAYGIFKVTNDISQYCRAKLFNEIGKETKVMVRFSTVAGERGSADTVRDPRGFAVKFYTEDGNWDLVGNNTPVFFIKDAKKFPDFIHSQKRNPKTNCPEATMAWDFWSWNPESLHQVIILMSDRGIPYTYRNMNGYGSHTFSMINKNNEIVWVKFHFKTKQGIRCFTNDAAMEMVGKDPNWCQHDLVNHIEAGDFPEWELKIQVMTQEQARKWKYNPFDVTKVWPHKDFPLIDVGVMTLNKIPDNYFADVEQVAYNPSNFVDGISYSPDKMLQGRLFAYPDAHRYRLGVNYEMLPVNRPICPVHNYERDGKMNFGENGGSTPNYRPNSFDNIVTDDVYKGTAETLDNAIADYFDRNGPYDHDYFTQPGILYRDVMNEGERERLVSVIVDSMSHIQGDKKDEIIKRQLQIFAKADEQLAQRIIVGLNLDRNIVVE